MGDICNHISKPLSLNNRFKMIEMLNNYRSIYICENHDESLNDRNNNAYDIASNDAMFNMNETLKVNYSNENDVNDDVLMINNYVTYNENADDDDDNTGNVESHHRPDIYITQNKSNNDCYICSFITPQFTSLNSKLLYNEMRCIRGELNTQEYTLVKNNNLWSGYFCDFVPLMDSNNNINIPILNGKYIKTTSSEIGKYNKSYMKTMNDKCGKITNKFFCKDSIIKFPYPIKSFKYNYSKHLDRSKNTTNDRINPRENPRKKTKTKKKEQEPSSKKIVSGTKTY